MSLILEVIENLRYINHDGERYIFQDRYSIDYNPTWVTLKCENVILEQYKPNHDIKHLLTQLEMQRLEKQEQELEDLKLSQIWRLKDIIKQAKNCVLCEGSGKRGPTPQDSFERECHLCKGSGLK